MRALLAAALALAWASAAGAQGLVIDGHGVAGCGVIDGHKVAGMVIDGEVACRATVAAPQYEQSYTLGAASQPGGDGTHNRWAHGAIPDTPFIDGIRGSTTSYPYQFDIRSDGAGTAFNIRLFVSTVPSIDTTVDLSAAWETGWEIEVAFGGNSWTFNHSDFASDDADPYAWPTSVAAVRTRAQALVDAIGTSSGAVVTFRIP